MKKLHFSKFSPPALILLGLMLVLSFFLSFWLYFLFTPAVSRSQAYVYYVHPGASKHAVINDLAEQGIITHPILFALYAFPHPTSALKTGEYYFGPGSTPRSIWKQITTGSGLFYRPFAIIPGWTFKQLRMALSKAPALRHTTTVFSDQQIMEQLGSASVSPEGEFFPETYNYTRGDTDFLILKRAFHLMQAKLEEVWKNRASGLFYQTPYQALIAASVIEKEAYLNTERPIISGVIINRLAKNMLLQIDATVIYGLGQRYDGKIYKQNLLEDTAYNTYVHSGLPPTPIAMPGLFSLEAATHPQVTNYYYYVAKGDGSHIFSNTLQEHNEAVRALRNKQKETVNLSLSRGIPQNPRSALE
jgi:UPF0755 protein